MVRGRQDGLTEQAVEFHMHRVAVEEVGTVQIAW
jgi:hypothetical protein